jgi:FtsZ-interacting cell division protein ZipA
MDLVGERKLDMELTIGILVVCVIAVGILLFTRSRTRKTAAKKTRAAKRAKVARDDARDIQRSIDSRR